MYRIYFVPEFPTNKITSDGREPWVDDPNSLRMRYKYLEAIAEHVQHPRGGCDPIQMKVGHETVSCGPAGVSRLIAVTRILNWKSVPAILVCRELPKYIQQATKIKDKEHLLSFFSRKPKKLQINRDGSFDLYNGAPQPKEVLKTFKACPETIQRVVELFTIERTNSGDLEPY